jgi:three-Cys-motif partner protein
MKFFPLPSAIDRPWTGPLSTIDGLPLRDSGAWIEEKHRNLAYFSSMFATAMKPTPHKRGWSSRVYLEFFSGPGKCHVRETQSEELGSPLRIIDEEFTRFIFIDIDTRAARALERRLASHPNANKVEIWNGDCAEVIDRLNFSRDGLTFTFVDPTGISQVPFSLIAKLRRKTRGDILINVAHGMGIKMNLHQYTPDADEDCALTQFLGNDSWKKNVGKPHDEFFRLYLDAYRDSLAGIGLHHSRNHVMVNMKKNVPLYLLLFASAHELGQKFWNTAVSGSNPQSIIPGILD